MPAKFRRRLVRYIPFLQYVLAVFFAVLVFVGIFKIFPSVFTFFKNFYRAQTFIGSVILNRDINLKQANDRTNILILGVAGGNHEGANLSDTMIFLSVNLKTGKIIMMSISRDIWVDSLQAKINAAYAFGEEKRDGGGFTLAKAAVSEVLDQPVHYTIKIDFAGFEKIINLLGGVEINVERTFDDYKYPIAGKENDECGGDPEYLCRFEHLHFDAGGQTMDGARALEYVRSRQAEGDEGTDFARSRRQQKLIVALKSKFLSVQTLLNPGKIWQLKDALGESVQTDIDFSELDDFVKLFQKYKENKIENLVLDTGDEKTGRKGLLVNPPVDQYGAWVLVSQSGNWDEVRKYVSCELESQECPQPQNK